MHENKIKVAVGQAMSGKTFAMCCEIEYYAQDENNFVVIVGLFDDYESVLSKSSNAILFRHDHVKNAIAHAVSKITETVKDENKMVFLFIDAGAYKYSAEDREKLAEAMKKGVNIFIATQKFSELDGGNIKWLNENCDAFVVTKYRTPRLLTSAELKRMH